MTELANAVEQDFDFIAELKYRTAAQGGIPRPTSSGYRPAIQFPFDTMYTSGRQNFIGRSIVHPGDTVMAEIKIASPQRFVHRLHEGLEFIFAEGARIIGTGVIRQVVNPVLIRP